MKLGTLKEGGRDGTLVLVSRDLKRAIKVPDIAPTMQFALDNWERVSGDLLRASRRLHEVQFAAYGGPQAFPLETSRLAAPLPRACQFLDGAAYLHHVELVRRAQGIEMPKSFLTEPLMYQGLSDSFIGAEDNIQAVDEADGIDFEAEVAVVLDDVPMGVSPAEAGQSIRLVMLLNDVTLRNLVPGEMAKGFGMVNAKPASSFSPVAVTLDELGEYWHGGKLHFPLVSHVNGRLFGNPNAGNDMHFDFPTLIAHAAKTRRLAAGTILGGGTVSNKDHKVGSSCIAERRTLETLMSGKPDTPFLKFGDRIRIEMLDGEGKSIFGAIDQRITRNTSSLD